VRFINDPRPQKRAGFLGIDLTSKESKPSACLGLDNELNLIYRGFLNRDSDILQIVNRFQFELIAIDAPLSLPKGLCCLEENCPCQPTAGVKGRNCERELARLGIPCYFTTKKSIIKAMVYRGIRLKTELESQGYKVIEVYPYASKIRLFGKPVPSKLEPKGLAFLKQRICQLLPNITACIDGFNHDMCDATIAAYTAFLCSQGKVELCGEPGEGTICLPFLDRAAHDH
jgi:predicted nuclease with RNAse H fold